MGYYTTYALLSYESERDLIDQKEMKEEDTEKMFDWIKDNASGMRFENLDDAKWYKAEDDMTALSIRYPDVIFELYGNGEDSDDSWKSVFYKGKVSSVIEEKHFPAMNLSALGMSDPSDPTAPKEEPENAYFFAEEDSIL